MQATTHTAIKKINGVTVVDEQDVLATEEPLEIRVAYTTPDAKVQKNVSVTMRTPGNDSELAVGFLFTEGVISSGADVRAVQQVTDNVVKVNLAEGVTPDINQLERNFYTTSSCGVCGKASIDAIKTVCDQPDTYPYDALKCSVELIYALPAKLRMQQSVFEQTGAIHACALFDTAGNLLLMREDVGRHNALDKLIGAWLMADKLPAGDTILLLSGRASFELIQKAAMAGIKIIAAVGAPSSLAVQLSEDMNMTLLGFLRAERFNIYSGAQRIVIS